MNNKFVWLFGMGVVIVFQWFIVYFWENILLGTLINMVVLIISLVFLGRYLLQRDFIGHVKSDFLINNTLPTEILSDKDILYLPAIVQLYLRYTKSVGQPKIKNFRAEFTGGIRSKPSDEYMKVKTVQYNFYQAPSRYFFISASKMGIPATGLHLYHHENATFEVKLLNWFKVVDAKGEKMNQAETVTLLNDMCFIAPATLIDSRIRWEDVNDTTVKATFTNGNIKVSALLYFKPNGEIINFISNDRYSTDGKKYENYPWATPVEAFRMTNGYFLPAKAKLIYQQPEGDFTYGELEYKSVKYNLEKMDD